MGARLAPEAGVEIARALANGSEIDLEGWHDRIAGELDEASAPVALENGDRVHGEVALEQLADGIVSCAPRTFAAFGEEAEHVLVAFAADDGILERAPLGERLARFLHEHGRDRVAALARFESRIGAARRGDDRIEQLCEPGPDIVDALDHAMVIRSEAFTLTRFEHDVASLHAGLRPAPGPHAFLVGMYHGEVSVVAAPEHVARALDALADGPRPAREIVAILAEGKRRRGWPSGGLGWLLELIAADVIGWMHALGEQAVVAQRGPAAEGRRAESRAARRARARA